MYVEEHPMISNMTARWIFRANSGGYFKDKSGNDNHLVEGGYNIDSVSVMSEIMEWSNGESMYLN